MTDHNQEGESIKVSHEGVEYEVPVERRKISEEEGWEVLLSNGDPIKPFLMGDSFFIKLPEDKGMLWVREWLGMIPIPDRVDYVPSDFLRDDINYMIAEKVEK